MTGISAAQETVRCGGLGIKAGFDIEVDTGSPPIQFVTYRLPGNP